jgi:hypothetical protein
MAYRRRGSAAHAWSPTSNHSAPRSDHLVTGQRASESTFDNKRF